MTTGKHSICDVYCRKCGEGVGWLYESAEQASEQYKVGKFLVEMDRVEGLGEHDRKKIGEKSEPGGWGETGSDLLSRVRYVQGELGLEDLEQRLKALLDEENRASTDRRDEEEV